MVASEAVPFAKTGGLADVSAALAGALSQMGHQVTLVMPRYRGVPKEARDVEQTCRLTLGDRPFDVGLIERDLGARMRVVFVRCDELYDRDGLYGVHGSDHPDNAVRFGLLARAALEYVVQTGRHFDVVHAHDWQAGLVPLYLRSCYSDDPVLQTIPVLFTIHNIAYQGTFAPSVLPQLDIDRDWFTIDGLEFWGRVSFLKAGINFSDLITTVSEGYAREILTPEFGYGFEGVVAARQEHLRGILNGIDVDVWDPVRDPWLPAPFSSEDLGGKRLAKRHLLERFWGPVVDEDALDRPIVGMVSRLVHQKGFDLVEEVIDQLPALGASYVVLGTGEARYEEMWRAAAVRHSGTVAVQVGYDERLAHLIEAGADIFLMPSRYEPCGLNQMYSMRYGTVPVVRATGGLDDAVTQYDDPAGRGTGFKFVEFTSRALVATLGTAVTVFADKPRWRSLQLEGMSRDFSWTVSAEAYVKEYRALMAQRSNGGPRTHA